MNKNLTEIAYILDRSGSMNPMVESAIAGFNRFLKEQIAAPGEARLTLVLFDDEYLLPCDGIPIEEAVELDTTTYVPRGCTALLDAIGRTIDDLGKRLAAIPEEGRPGQVIVAIFTDGLENASQHYTGELINEMIRRQREVYGWEFLFLAANQDAIATATRMGIDPRHSSSVQYSHKGMHSSHSSLSRKMSAMRHHASTGEKLADYDAPMEEIVKEEEEREDPEQN